MAQQLLATAPDIPLIAQANRAFLRRAVHMLAESGIRQFLDIGSGIPTLGNVHEVAREVAPDAGWSTSISIRLRWRTAPC